MALCVKKDEYYIKHTVYTDGCAIRKSVFSAIQLQVWEVSKVELKNNKYIFF